MEGGKLRATYEQDLNRLKEAQRNAAVANLENTRTQALSNLEAERQSNTAAYNQQRSTANAQNRMNAKNFQEYLASTGRANSGLPAQARMQYDNNLQNSLNYLNAGEAGALADINRRSTLAHDTYNTGLAGANAQIEADYIKNLMNERDKEYQRQIQEQQRQLQERQLQEQIRQFNENMALQREQLYNRFSGGSGGGGVTYTSNPTSTKNSVTNKTTNKTTNKNSQTLKSAVKSGSVASSNVSKQLDLLARKNNFDIGEIRTSQGGLANVKLYTVNGVPYYKSGNKWIAY